MKMEVQLYKIDGSKSSNNKMRAIGSVVFDDEYKVNGFKVFEGTNGLFVSMPSRKQGNAYKDVFHAITKEAYAELQEAILAKYNSLND